MSISQWISALCIAFWFPFFFMPSATQTLVAYELICFIIFKTFWFTFCVVVPLIPTKSNHQESHKCQRIHHVGTSAHEVKMLNLLEKLEPSLRSHSVLHWVVMKMMTLFRKLKNWNVTILTNPLKIHMVILQFWFIKLTKSFLAPERFYFPFHSLLYRWGFKC